MYQILSSESSDECLNTFIEDISIPYCGRLPQELRIGSTIKIMGKINTNAKRFAINLMVELISCIDIALHFNPRFKEGIVVRNSRVSDEWCNEERETPYMPFERNRDFNLIIVIEEEVYSIFVNGVHFIDFTHRLPFSDINSIAIDGDLKISSIQFDTNSSNSLFSLRSQQTPKIQTIFDPKLPFIHKISNGLRIGLVFTIIGRTLNNANRFDINLIQKKNLSQNPDIALHISVRFGKTLSESTIVRNYRFGGQWGPEDRYCTEFPFIAEKIFDIRIIVENNRFIIIINGKHFTDFPNRLYPLSDTNQIEIYGNINLFTVRF